MTVKQSKDSLVLKQHKKLKEEYPNTIFLYGIGKCCEAIAEDAEIISEILKIPLIKNKKEYSITGFDITKLDMYLKKILNENIRVAIVTLPYKGD